MDDETAAQRVGAEEPIDEAYIGLDTRTYDYDGHPEGDVCARCGGSHAITIIYPFYRPILDHGDGKAWRWWMTCPVTGDPVLVADLKD